MGLGLTVSTPICSRQKGAIIEVRVGLAFFGQTQMTKEQRDAAGNNPFSNLWWDDFISAKGLTYEAALEAPQQEVCRDGRKSMERVI